MVNTKTKFHLIHKIIQRDDVIGEYILFTMPNLLLRIVRDWLGRTLKSMAFNKVRFQCVYVL